jgi:hypothetical protein
MSEIPRFGIVPIDNSTLAPKQDRINNIKGYALSGKTMRPSDCERRAGGDCGVDFRS